MLFGLRSILLVSVILVASQAKAQHGYWQQEVDYTMHIDFDATSHQFDGNQKLVYTNNSPDTLNTVYYHLYFNAFQPGSMMDARSRSIIDPDGRILDRISKLKPDEIGYHKIISLKQNGKSLDFEVKGTLLQVKLDKPILPNTEATFDMKFESQVPVQIRRSGRNNFEGVDYTMTQWYPKMAEYDRDGWAISPYVSREFHGVFGSFDVFIDMDAAYTLAGTGEVQNPEEVGHGYGSRGSSSSRIEWHFHAENVHDFAWAADPEYRHTQSELANGTKLHFFYMNDTSIAQNWEDLIPYTVRLFEIMNDRFGEYPYPQFSVIQGGDGGMEYPMCTMISGTGSFNGLVSVTVHEAIHNWYYGVLATNESKYPWMDEGFTTFAQNIVLDSLHKKSHTNPHRRSYTGYVKNVNLRGEEPLSTHADHYETNAHYSSNAYSKGCVFLAQLEYLMGSKEFNQGMKRYWNTWKFKHPTPTDFKRIMEKASGLELEWYFENWVGTTKTIDYAVGHMGQGSKGTEITIERKGEIPMPIEIEITSEQGKQKYMIPLELMQANEQALGDMKVLEAWPWTFPYYTFTIPAAPESIVEVVIDPSNRLADTNRKNNKLSARKPNFKSK